jgi:hypothetical protein
VVETLGSTETSRSHANDEDVYVTIIESVSFRSSMASRKMVVGEELRTTHISAPMVGDCVGTGGRWGLVVKEE